MIPHPAELDAALGLVAWEPRTVVTVIDPDGTETVLPAVEGVFTSTALAWPRHTLDLTIPAGLTPGDTVPPVTPWGGRVRVEVGAYVFGTPYVFTVHTLDVSECDVIRPDGVMTLKAVSAEGRVNEDRYGTADVTPAGATSDVVAGIVRRTLGASWPVVSTLTVDDTLAAGAYELDDDVWPTVEDIMDATGGEAWFRSDGTLVLRDAPVKGTPVVTLKGGEGGTLLKYRAARRWAANVVHAVYDDGTSKRVGTWQDTSGGATDVSGPYGRHARREDFSVPAGKLPTTTQANRAAAALARRAAAPFRRVELETVPIPWLEPGDTVRVSLPGTAEETHLVEAVTWPLSQLDPMTVITQDDAYTRP